MRDFFFEKILVPLSADKDFVRVMDTILEQLKKYFDNTPRDVIEEEWSKFNAYDDVGPTVDEFLSLTDEWLFDWKNILVETAKIEKTPNFYSEFFYLCIR